MGRPDVAHARAELDRFLGIEDDDDVSFDPPAERARPRRRSRSGDAYDGTCPPRPDWFDDAACKGKTDLFFATGQVGRNSGLSAEQLVALSICQQCPHEARCRDYGREHRLHGIWGGETEIERAAAGFLPHVGALAAAARAERAKRRGSVR